MDHSKNLRTMVICLTLLFIFAQCSFFLIHMQAEELVDTLVNSSVSSSFFYPAPERNVTLTMSYLFG